MRDYLPARLVRAKKRWYFSYYQTNPSTGIRQRHRESFDIGRIALDQRLAVAKQIIESINGQLPYGYPYDHDFYSRSVSVKIKDAFELVTANDKGLRHASVLSYRYSIKKFVTFLQSIKLYNEEITAVTKKVAMAYSDHLVKCVSGRSHNNDINEMRRVFNVLKTREIISYNPFDGIPKQRVEEKQRRSLDPEEAVIIINHLAQADKSVYLSCALLYFCLIRPNEQRQLQRKDVSLEYHLIRIKGSISKNHKSQTVTIPDQLSEILIGLGLNDLRDDEYLLGAADKLGKSKSVGKSSISNRYRDIIKFMFRSKMLDNIEGNVLYSWKDTGAEGLKRSGIDAFTLQDQGRWHSLSQAQAYLKKSTVASEFVRKNHRL